MAIRVLIADDSAVMRQAVSRLLSTHNAIEVVGQACNLEQTLQMTDDLKPDVVVMDLHVARGSQLEVKQHLAGCKLLAISFAPDEECEFLADRMGAAELLDKIDLADELIPAIVQLATQAVAQTPHRSISHHLKNNDESLVNRTNSHVPSFDIFFGESDRDAQILERVQGLAAAVERMDCLAREIPGKYFVFSPETHQILARANTQHLRKSKASGAA